MSVERIEKAMARQRFLARILTANEQRLVPREGASRWVAGRWAAKEAVAKAAGVHLRWHDVEVLNEESGKPVAQIAGMQGARIHISITHERGMAAAVAMLET